ncbi:hypothetical protein FANTH_10313 [Fusarium anthophilum]|uniref:Uncharacterized protein n=1 Tax=Fusarium anthophilum TaxID=48485 RepID=A0A8H4Z2F7_9HYPO|nr:hypothetical protein FANTH_10313 [Fusarium anthophilum]
MALKGPFLARQRPEPAIRWRVSVDVSHDDAIFKHGVDTLSCLTPFDDVGAPGIGSSPYRQRRSRASLTNCPRTTTKADRETLLNILRKGELLAVEGIQSEKLLLSLEKGFRCLGTGPSHDHGFYAPSTHPKPFIPSNDASHPVDKLVVYVSSDKEERDLALFTTLLPQRLMEWLMIDPKTQKGGTAPLLGVSLLKNVLTAPPNVIDAFLTSEGVGRIRIIEVNLSTMRQEAAPQNTTSNGPADQPSQSRFDYHPYSNVLFEFQAHRNRSENSAPANIPTKTSEKALAKQPATPVRSNEQPESVAGLSSARTKTDPDTRL